MLNLLKLLIFGHIHHWVITETYDETFEKTRWWADGVKTEDHREDHRIITIQQACSKCGELRITRTELL